ncbi:MAG: hypothetical protein GX793_02405 [Bacteroidales bacterium]|jgi:GLPGLI family protein|nr:hypothetical protein [Bacteroidales bacterium]MCK9498436.1 hypothetical protein [Bacteroidales bacterium]MDY0315096.1 hypothetical protein [Bacteroidales bacterium]NLB85893.1 hypothetical protein [Bacteroidales bacterium]
MKTTFKILLVLVAVSFSLSSFSQKKAKPFKGTITYDITYEADEELDEMTKAQMPSNIIMYISGNKVRTDQVSAFYSIASISDYDKGGVIMLMDAMGMKIAVKQSKEEIDEAVEEADLPSPDITFIEETKVIAGIKCKKAEIIMDEDIVEVYYTDEFNVPEGINDLQGFKGINGILMEYSITQQGMTMTMTVKEVKAGKVKAGLFVIPDDYELKSAEELGGLFGM